MPFIGKDEQHREDGNGSQCQHNLPRQPVRAISVSEGKEKPSQRNERDARILHLGPEYLAGLADEANLKGIGDRPNGGSACQNYERIGPDAQVPSLPGKDREGSGDNSRK